MPCALRSKKSSIKGILKITKIRNKNFKNLFLIKKYFLFAWKDLINSIWTFDEKVIEGFVFCAI